METKNCQNCKQDFTIEPDDFLFYEKIKVPPPTFCPDCRFQRRLAFRNDRSLYHRECDFCKKRILSIYRQGSPIRKVFCPSCWWGDGWAPFSFGREYDFSKDFFTQYFEFKKTVPHQALYQANFVDSVYANFGTNYKSCYLVFGGYNNENLSYGCLVGDTKDSVDVTLSLNLELCYETINCFKSARLRFCHSCEDSNDLILCTDCRGCISCLGCVGLRNKQYHIFNESYSKSEYEKKLKEFELGSFSNFQKFNELFEKFYLTRSFKYNRNRNTVDCDGDDLRNSKNTHSSFWGSSLENVRHSFFAVNCKDSMDITALGNMSGISEMLFEVSSSFGGSLQIVGIRTLFDRNAYYSEDCHNCNDIFGCIGLKKQSYCIFNKQYSKEKYEEVVIKIKEQMQSVFYVDKKGLKYNFGDFWPIEMSPFAYNETKAQEYFNLNKEEILLKGYNWFEKESTEYSISLKNSEIPDGLLSTNESILKEVIECAHKNCNHECTHAFKIVASEFQVIKNLGVPIPRLCHNCRYYERLKKQNPIKLWHRKCMNEGCENEFETSYSPDRPEVVYCEKCYQQEVM